MKEKVFSIVMIGIVAIMVMIFGMELKKEWTNHIPPFEINDGIEYETDLSNVVWLKKG